MLLYGINDLCFCICHPSHFALISIIFWQMCLNYWNNHNHVEFEQTIQMPKCLESFIKWTAASISHLPLAPYTHIQRSIFNKISTKPWNMAVFAMYICMYVSVFIFSFVFFFCCCCCCCYNVSILVRHNINAHI